MADPPGNQQPELKIRRRRLPHWTLEGSVYFVTFRTLSRTLSAPERLPVLDHIALLKSWRFRAHGTRLQQFTLCHSRCSRPP